MQSAPTGNSFGGSAFYGGKFTKRTFLFAPRYLQYEYRYIIISMYILNAAAEGRLSGSMKVFWRITAICAVLIFIAATVTFVVWRPAQEEDEEFVSYLDSSVSDDDDRITSSYVSNSDSNFFVRGKQLTQTIRLESQTAPPFLHTFGDTVKIKKTTPEVVRFDSDLTVRKAVILQDTTLEKKDGSLETLSVGQNVNIIGSSDNGKWFYDADGGRFSTQDAVRLCQRNAFEGDQAHPYFISISQKQYIRFGRAGESVYLHFVPDNEFVSLFFEQIPSNFSYELYDSQHNKVGVRVAHAGEKTLQLYHHGQTTQEYVLKLTGAPTDQPICMTFYRDDNEWRQNMTNVEINRQYSGKFDYYGDEDFFTVSEEISDETDAIAMTLDGVDADLQILAYDRNKNLIGRYTRQRGSKEKIVLYGLENLYALGIRTVDGDASLSKYSVRFSYVDVQLLGLETFGFKISSKADWSSDSDAYYTAVCKGLENKQIVEVQAVGKRRVSMTLLTYSGAKYTFKEGENIPLHAGKNTIEIVVENGSDKRKLTLVITDSNGYDVDIAFTRRATTLQSDALGTGKQLASLGAGEKVLCYGNVQNGFLRAELLDGSGKIGWVRQADVFDGYQKCTVPSAYKNAITRLSRQHPNWKFTFVRVGSTLSEAVSAELGQSPIIDTGGGWRRAKESEIRYYMNPENFLNERDIFMFEKQVYQEGIYTRKGIGAVWAQRDEALFSADYYAACFMEAGRIAGLSPYFIAARASVESGGGTSRLAKGQSAGYEGYYNFYGIGAVDSNPIQGAAFAKSHNWNSQRIAIVEGASWIKDQYIMVQQYTPYFIKYSFVPGRKWHQYMTDITAPKLDAAGCYRAHAAGGTLNTAIEFVIPVFD